MSDVALSKQLVLGEMLARWSRKTPDKEALVFRGRRCTYRELNERVNRLANSLMKLGIKKGDKVSVIFVNSIEIVECYFALMKIGAIAVPQNIRFNAKEFAYQIDNSDSLAVIYSESFSKIITSMRDRIPKVEHYICTGPDGEAGALVYEFLVQDGSPEEPQVMIEDDDPAFIMYTAGTTGRPKGAVLTHKNQMMVAISLATAIRTKMDRFLIAFPLFHQAALTQTVFGFFGGGTLILLDAPTPESIMALVQKERIEGVTLVPALWNWIVNHPQINDYDLSSIKMGRTGAAPMPVEVKKRIVELLPHIELADCFGQTETSATVVIALHEDFMRKHGTLGKPTVCMEARVVDPEGNDVATGEAGEIVYRGPCVMKEYYKDPAGTAEAFRGGWFHSGDVVRQDEEGYIYIVDRLKDVVISGGENIYPVEIENVLHSHPKILEAAVIGIPDPDWGESVKAYIVPKQGQSLTEEEVVAYCRQELASYKKPKSIRFIEALPRNSVGKVLKTALREIHRQEASQPP